MTTKTRIGLKTYLEITRVGLVSEAAAGDNVYIQVSLRNNHTADIFATVTIAVNGIAIQGTQATLRAGVEYVWPLMSFVMPNKSVQGIVAAFYATAYPPTEDDWVMDDEQTFSVALAGEPPPQWEFLDSEPFTILPGVVPAEWEHLDSEPFTIEPGLVPAVWEFLYSQPFTIEPGVGPPPPPPPPIAGIPTWMIAAGAVGVVAAIGALVYLSTPAKAIKKKKEPEKKE